MAFIDPRTIVSMAALMSLQMAIVLWFMKRNYPRDVLGLGWWATAPLLWMLTAALFGARGKLPELFTIVLSNIVLVIGVATDYSGTRLFFGHAANIRRWVLVALGVGAAMALFNYVQPSYGARVAVVSTVLVVLYSQYFRFLYRHGGKRFPTRLLLVALGLQIAVLLARLFTLVKNHGAADLLEPGLVQLAYLSMYALTILTLAIGSVLMANDHLRLRLEALATRDELTGTLNRRALLVTVGAELDRARRTGRGPALLLLDMDHFKQINDTRGHLHGDAVLRHFADQVRGALRRTDTFGRYGGEEFVVLLPETDAAGAQEVAAHIHRALASGHALDNPVSIGASLWRGAEDSAESLLARADSALYRAKQNGRNQTQLEA